VRTGGFKLVQVIFVFFIFEFLQCNLSLISENKNNKKGNLNLNYLNLEKLISIKKGKQK